MSVKVAINGFGRIGRLAFRQMFGAEGYEVVAINDLTSAKMLAHLLKYDSTQGNYVAQGHTVDFHEGEGEDNYIVVDGKKIVIYKMPNAAELPWGKLGVDVVLECTGFYTSKAKAQAHIDAGARKVVISAPAGNDLPTIVYNVNHNTLTKEDKIISAASCTTNCLAPMAKALNNLAPIESGIMCTIHAYTGDQMPLDGPQKKACKVRQKDAREIIEVKAAGTPVIFQHLAELVITEETDNGEEQITARDVEQICEHIGEQPPDLPMQNFGRGEAEKTVDHAAWVNDGQRIGNEIADGDDEHQVRNAAIAVLETEAFEFFAEIFHMSTYLFA